MSFRGRGRGGFHHNNNNSNNRQNNGQVEVEILGWNGASAQECVNFVARKCRIAINNFSVENNNAPLRGFVQNSKDAEALVQWSGVKFAGNSLKISIVNGIGGLGLGANNPGGGTETTIETITMFLRSRYNPEIKLLNLSAVQQDPTLSAKGFFGSLLTTSKFFPALMKIASDLKLEVKSADLSNNNLSDLQTISTLAPTFPMLENLALLNNNISRVKVFDTWKRKLNFVREVVLVGNPITSNPTEFLKTKQELMKVFPRLVVFNNEVVRNEQVLNNNLSLRFTAPQPMFFADAEVQTLLTGFLTNYYGLWDSNRADLMVLYQDESQFSLQVDTSASGSSLPASSPDYGNYLLLSRNLTKVSNPKMRMSKVAKGQQQIYKLFTQLPRLRHDLNTKPDNYSVESYRLPAMGAICITIHGSFEETAQPDNTEHLNLGPTGGRRFNGPKKKVTLAPKSFDRLFVVVPGPNNSFIVASDLLCLRNMVDSSVFTSAPTPPTVHEPSSVTPTPMAPGIPSGPSLPSAGPSVADLPAEVKAGLAPNQQELLVRVLLETKLTIQYGVILCQQSNWDYALCMNNFKNLAGLLPPDAFLR